MYVYRSAPFFFLIILLFILVPFSQGRGEENSDSQTEENKVDVRVTELRARISPQLEIVLPSGNIYEHFVTNFNNLEITFNLSFSVIGNTLGGDITFAYPSFMLSPYVTFYQSLDFENYFAPQISGSDIILVPTTKYIIRKRGADLGLRYELFPNFSLVPALVITDTFKGSLTENRVLEEGVDITPQFGLVYDTVLAEDTATEPIFTGLYAETTFGIRYRNDFSTPVELNSKILFLLYHNIREKWFFEERLSLVSPLKIWEKGLASIYSLGGFDSIRGYKEGSINALRFLSFSTNIEREVFKDRELRLRMLKRVVRLHQYRIFFLTDALLTQDRLRLENPIKEYCSIGAGIAFSLSGKEKTHFQIRLSAAQALTEAFAPIVYFRTSLFRFETSL
jgi:hypothetical protein